MIVQIRIANFKSIGEITLRLGKFNCLIGMNGAGKSTLLQALDFISQLMSGEVANWLESRGWTSQELNSKLRKENNIKIAVATVNSDGSVAAWAATFNRHDLRCSNEVISIHVGEDEVNDPEDLGLLLPKDIVFRVQGQSYRFRGEEKKDIAFNYQGSILSQLRDTELSAPIRQLRETIRGIRSLELLSPHLMRKRARTSEFDIGAGGEKLSGFLSTIKGEKRNTLVRLLQQFYPKLVDFKISNLRAGWKRLVIVEQYGERKIETEASHLNDGLLRILAILAQTSSDRSLILLDEIENGMNQEVIEKLVNVLISCPQQVVVTTHSPLMLNYLSDEQAIESVKFIYKSPAGETKSRPFFAIARIREKLEMMGAGDAFVDTNLIALSDECNRLDLQQGEKKKANAHENAHAHG